MPVEVMELSPRAITGINYKGVSINTTTKSEVRKMSDCIEEVGIAGINYKGVSINITTKKDNSAITFQVGPEIKAYLTIPMMIDDGRTVGQANRQALHARLDALLDANLE